MCTCAEGQEGREKRCFAIHVPCTDVTTIVQSLTERSLDVVLYTDQSG